MQEAHIRTLATALSCALVVTLTACSKSTGSSTTGSPAPSASAGASPSAPVPVGAAPVDAPPAGSGPSFSSGFEGAIVMHTTSARGPADMLFLAKGGKLRIEVPGLDGQMTHSIFDPVAKKVTILMDSQQLAMQMPIPAVAGAAPLGKDTTITRTGKHETVAGYDCEDWEIATDGGKTGRKEAVCVAQGLAFFDFTAMAGPTGGTSRSWAEELRDKNGFPLRAVELDASGKEISRMEAKKIERKALTDATFAVPAGYRVMNVPGMEPGGARPHP